MQTLQQVTAIVTCALLVVQWFPVQAKPHISVRSSDVRVNRTPPVVSPPSRKIHFSWFPDDTEITKSRVFPIPLLKVEGGHGSLWENRALARALQSWASSGAPDDTSALAAFLARYPKSAWRASLLANMGVAWRQSGYVTRSIDALEQAWALTRSQPGNNAAAIANWTAGELAHMHGHLGHENRLIELKRELGGRKLEGPATEQWTIALESLALSKQHPEDHARCGPLALASVLRKLGRDVASVAGAKATAKGVSMTQLEVLARDAGTPMRAIHRAPGSSVPVPSIAHWKANHYTAILERGVQNGRDMYLVENPLFEKSIWVTRQALDEETSGYYLALPEDGDERWRPASRDETDQVWGSCFRGSVDETQIMYYAPALPDIVRAEPICPGMARYRFHAMLVSLNIQDIPVGYSPAYGPAVNFRVVYNQRDAAQSAIFSYSNLGPKWTFDFLSYVKDQTGYPGRAIVYLRGGGEESFTFQSLVRLPVSGGVNYQSQAELWATAGTFMNITRYERRLPDGSREIFATPEPAGQNRRVFLTEIVDRAGNSVRITYDSLFRVVALTDAAGQVTRLSYELPGDPLKITRVTDPFGRAATFSYNQGKLVRITDVIGLSSSFTYDGDFINRMETPYGVTTFRTGLLADPELRTDGDFRTANRWLEATDPIGETERLELRMPLTRQRPAEPGTLYWDKLAWKQGGRDPANARTVWWKLVSASILSGVPWRSKQPLESETLFHYRQLPPDSDQLGSLALLKEADGLPVKATRPVEGGTQASHFEYNRLGNITRHVDSSGRSFSFIYSSDGIDLTEVLNDRSRESLARLSYNSQHLPLTLTDAAGQTTRLTYNSRGQVLTATNAKGETTVFAYNDRGYLASIQGPIPQAIARYTYDAIGRVQTVTDSDGYRLAFEYDAMDRITKVTYPGGSFNQVKYDRLDAVEWIDRLGRSTRATYDAARRPVSVVDPLGRETKTRWCACGAAEQLTDPAGNVTTWERDVQGRITAKVLPDGATTRYIYGSASGRLVRMTDPKGQIQNYEYTVDGEVRRISFDNSTVATAPVTFTYDANYGRLVNVTDGVGETVFGYHPASSPGALQLAAVTGPVPGVRIDYSYDELGRVVRRSINGTASTVRYDPLGRVDRVENILGEFLLTYVGATGRLDTVQYPNRQVTRYGYFDNLGDRRLRMLRHDRGDGSVLSEFTYEYAKTGEILRQKRYQPEFPSALVDLAYKYDDGGQLIGAEAVGEDASVVSAYNYEYDAAANRVLEKVNGDAGVATHNTANQLVSLQRGDATRHFTYDANGNLLSDGVRTFEWDARDRLVAVNQTGRRSEFTYDAFDRRVRVVEREADSIASDRWLLWCGSAICEERSPDGTPSKRFSTFGETNGEDVFYYTHDHLGTIRQLTSGDGDVAGSFDFDPWGRLTSVENSREPSFDYTGHWRHPSTGLLLAQRRAYDPDLGRWLTRDPIAEDGGINLYGYVQNDPVSFIDIDGLSRKKITTEQVTTGDPTRLIQDDLTEAAAKKLVQIGGNKIFGRGIGDGIVSLITSQTDALNVGTKGSLVGLAAAFIILIANQIADRYPIIHFRPDDRPPGVHHLTVPGIACEVAGNLINRGTQFIQLGELIPFQPHLKQVETADEYLRDLQFELDQWRAAQVWRRMRGQSPTPFPGFVRKLD